MSMGPQSAGAGDSGARLARARARLGSLEVQMTRLELDHGTNPERYSKEVFWQSTELANQIWEAKCALRQAEREASGSNQISFNT